jgi:hypothetical protein
MSTTPHKASAEQWASIEQLASTCIYDLVILELRDRIEALEAAQREAAMNELRAASAEARPATGEPTDRELRELFWYRPKGLETEAAALRRVYQAGMAAAVQSSAQQEISAMTNCHLSGPAPSPYGSWSEWFETEGSKGVIHGIRMEALPFRSSAQQEIADAEAFGLTSTSGSLVDRSAPAPASSLVERVMCELGMTNPADAGIAIHAIADWLRTHGDPAAHAWAMRLEQEAAIAHTIQEGLKDD